MADRTSRRSARKKKTIRYEWPDELITSTILGRMGKAGMDFRLSKDECVFVRRLDGQPEGKTIFGSGYLLTPEATRRKQACKPHEGHVGDASEEEDAPAVVVRLSQRERDLISQQ